MDFFSTAAGHDLGEAMGRRLNEEQCVFTCWKGDMATKLEEKFKEGYRYIAHIENGANVTFILAK